MKKDTMDWRIQMERWTQHTNDCGETLTLHWKSGEKVQAVITAGGAFRMEGTWDLEERGFKFGTKDRYMILYDKWTPEPWLPWTEEQEKELDDAVARCKNGK